MFFYLLAACSTSTAPEAPVAEPTHEAPTAQKSAAGWSHYGAEFTLASAADCKTVTQHPEANLDKTLRVEGEIKNVCQKAGCWMVIADDDGEFLRIRMKDHAFGVPTDTKTGPGTRVDVEGTLIKKELDSKTLAHLKSEAKGTPEELEKQFAPKFEIIATGISVKSS